MELGWSALVLLLAATAVVWFLQDSLAARERANAAAMEACRRLSLQFLDGTVAFARLRFIRDRGRLAVRRTYVFDYTANSIERRQGFVILLGRRVESVGYAPGEEQRAQRTQQPPVTISVSATLPPDALEEPKPAAPTPSNHTAVVLDLAEWRQRRRGTEQQPSPRRAGNSEADGQDSHP